MVMPLAKGCAHDYDGLEPWYPPPSNVRLVLDPGEVENVQWIYCLL